MTLTGSDPGPPAQRENNARSFKTLDLHHHNSSDQTSYRIVIEDNFGSRANRLDPVLDSAHTLFSISLDYVSNRYPSYS